MIERDEWGFLWLITGDLQGVVRRVQRESQSLNLTVAAAGFPTPKTEKGQCAVHGCNCIHLAGAQD